MLGPLVDLHGRVRDGLNFRALWVLFQIKLLAVTPALDAKVLRVELGNFQLLADLVRLGREQKQQLVQKAKQQVLQVVGRIRPDLVAPADANGVQFGHVTEHGHPTLLKRFPQRFAPGVQSVGILVVEFIRI